MRQYASLLSQHEQTSTNMSMSAVLTMIIFLFITWIFDGWIGDTYIMAVK